MLCSQKIQTMLKNKNCRLSDLVRRQNNQQQLKPANAGDAVRPSFVQRLISIVFEHRELKPVPHVYTAVFSADRENLYTSPALLIYCILKGTATATVVLYEHILRM